jgi:hypothetical protein
VLGFLRRNGIALIALFVALGGTAYAVGTITGADVKNESLKGRDVDEGTLRVTRLVARPASNANVIADPPPQGSPPPEPPADFGKVYPVTPNRFRLKTPALVQVIGRVDARLQPPCTHGVVAAWVFIDGKHIAHVPITVSQGLPLPGAPIPGLTQFAPLNLQKGTHKVEVRVESVCDSPSPGIAGKVTAVHLGVIAHQY